MSVNDPTDTGSSDPEESITLSSQEPGAAVQITIEDSAAVAITPNQDIRVDLSAFSVPLTIADSDVQISSGGYNGNPSNVVVSGSNVTMTVPNVKANGDDQTENVMGSYTIRIKQSAGVTNAASGGEKTIEWQENFPDGAEKDATVDISRVVKLSKTGGTRGTMITATFKGFANGSATVDLNDAKLGEVTIADNSGRPWRSTPRQRHSRPTRTTPSLPRTLRATRRPATVPCSPSVRRQWLIPKNLPCPRKSQSSYPTGPYPTRSPR